MPSPPDVILVLSPRMANFVRFAVEQQADSPEILDFDDDGEFASAAEAEDAADALAAEISEQLSGERRGTYRDVAPMPDLPSRPSEAERVADKMAKAARKAVEE